VRQAFDNDGKVVVLEKFTQCNLNPNSLDYVARKVGDRYLSWDETNRRYVEYGNYDNKSKFIRIVMNGDVDAGSLNPIFLPFGFYGPLKYNSVTLVSGALAIPNNSMLKGSGSIPNSLYAANLGPMRIDLPEPVLNFTCSVVFPSIPLRTTGLNDNFANPNEAYWGIDTTKAGSSTRFSPEYVDLVRAKPSDINTFTDGDLTTSSFAFSLDNLRRDPSSTQNAVYSSSARTAGTSFTASGSYKTVLDAGFDRFTSPMYGGFDGFDITEKEPFRNNGLGSSELTSYTYYSLRKAIDSVKDPEVVECKKMLMPGITNEGLTGYLLDVCEDRADCLGIIDLNGDYVPNTENTSAESSRVGSVDTVTSNLKDRGINNSYGCTYYTWVQIRDNINNTLVWVPPSVVALGTMASSQRKSEVWFAPAGFNRGGLSEGSAGLPVVSVRAKLTKEDRDKLYE
jgi:hypothetical protein